MINADKKESGVMFGETLCTFKCFGCEKEVIKLRPDNLKAFMSVPTGWSLLSGKRVLCDNCSKRKDSNEVEAKEVENKPTSSDSERDRRGKVLRNSSIPFFGPR